MDKKGFTLLELTIVLALIAILAAILIILLNPWQQIGKGNDAKRKHDLDVLKKVLEDYYNDKGCYPLATQLCYDIPPGPVEVKKGFGAGAYLDSYTCHICADKDPNRPNFSPYLSVLPCDPEHPRKQYLYQVDATNGVCPKWYKTYDNLSLEDDADSTALGCKGSACGIAPNYGYNYGISSSNTSLDTSNKFNCISDSDPVIARCKNCGYGGTYNGCMIDPGCPVKSKIYASYSLCCSKNPPQACP